ncbi:Myosin-XV-like protein [Daphnia magna]|uniref:Myosin-XV-like protein n=1 Tax=Daphnia magna TaxID=35525 RepID=A0A164L3H4_9CRUS|nr:Myosin-XV-like protein [Daphnia magna]
MHQDAVAVEATSYSLLVYLARDGIGDLQERVVTWLNTMRMGDGGFVSIYDSIVATDDSIVASKVFMREGVEQQIERNRLDQMRDAAINIQRAVWTHQLRKDFLIQRRSAVLIQAWVRRYQARKRFNTIRRGVILAQAQFRATRQRRLYKELRQELQRREAERICYYDDEHLRTHECYGTWRMGPKTTSFTSKIPRCQVSVEIFTRMQIQHGEDKEEAGPDVNFTHCPAVIFQGWHPMSPENQKAQNKFGV